MKITFAITVCDEWKELSTLIDKLKQFNIHEKHQILIIRDTSKKVSDDTDNLNCYLLYQQGLEVVDTRLDGDFATFKNNILEHAKGEYIFQIDADEVPSDALLELIELILTENSDIDMFRVPRRNIVNGLTDEHIKKWGWHINSDGYINFPDSQYRIFKNNRQIKWINKVHEVLSGYKRYTTLPNDFFLWHIKDIAKQVKQNEYYSTLM